MEFGEMPASEYRFSCISLLSFSSICRISDELWNIKSALYLYSTPAPSDSNTDYRHFAKLWTLAANAMKTLTFILLFLVGQTTFGQSGKDTTISKWTLDSLRFKLWEKSETINRMKWAYALKVNKSRIDTTYVSPDSIVINYWTENNRQLYQESIKFRKVSFKKDLCKGLIVKIFFNDEERPEYIEYWDGLCYDETEEDENVKYFDARLRKIERILYDTNGQVDRKLIYEYQSYRSQHAYQITYQVDDGKRSRTVSKIDRYNFWN